MVHDFEAEHSNGIVLTVYGPDFKNGRRFQRASLSSGPRRFAVRLLWIAASTLAVLMRVPGLSCCLSERYALAFLIAWLVDFPLWVATVPRSISLAHACNSG